MKKQLTIAIATGAAVLAYFIIRKKYFGTYTAPEPITRTPPVQYKKRHHLTNAFTNAKKHALH